MAFLGALAPSLALAAIAFISILLDDSRKVTINGIYLFLFWFYLIFIVSFIGLFFYKALYEINEKILLVWTLIFWYAYAVNFDPINWLSVVFLIPTFVVLLAAFAPAHMDYFWKAFLYGWFLFILVFLAFVQFKSSSLNILSNPGKITAFQGYLAAFSFGMVSLSVILHSFHLFCFFTVS